MDGADGAAAHMGQLLNPHLHSHAAAKTIDYLSRLPTGWRSATVGCHRRVCQAREENRCLAGKHGRTRRHTLRRNAPTHGRPVAADASQYGPMADRTEVQYHLPLSAFL